MLFSFLDVEGYQFRLSSSTVYLPSLNMQHQRPIISQDMISSPYMVCKRICKANKPVSRTVLGFVLEQPRACRFAATLTSSTICAYVISYLLSFHR
ncbi:hypothetical protein TNCV_2694291 [Trichonephila clavipes]|nr:hypothetical protein TNCV_2694291 [Trichonephila clavipes]